MGSSSVSLSIIDAAVRPSALVRAQVDSYTANRLGKFLVAGRLSMFYLVNLLLYAGPLTLAGFGDATVTVNLPSGVEQALGLIVSDVDAIVDFAVRLFQNSAYIFLASVLVFGTFHVGLLLTRSSEGVLQSAHTVVYSTGIYLAGIFTLVWYLSTAEAISVADDWLIALQKGYIYFFIDALSVGVDLPSGRPGPVTLEQLAVQGKLALGGLFLCLMYFLYSLYLGARINHHATRFESLTAVATLTVAPAAYVIGSIALVVFGDLRTILTSVLP